MIKSPDVLSGSSLSFLRAAALIHTFSAEIEQTRQDRREREYQDSRLPVGYVGTLFSDRTIGNSINYTSLERRPVGRGRLDRLQKPVKIERDAVAFIDEDGYQHIRIYDGRKTLPHVMNVDSMPNLSSFRGRSFFEYVALDDGKIDPSRTGHYNGDNLRFFSPCTGLGTIADPKGKSDYRARVLAADKEFRYLVRQLDGKGALQRK